MMDNARSAAAARASDAPFAETHARLWSALDQVAADRSTSPSGLAKIAGLDATAFNPSKRITRDGRLRWPSMETVAKVLSATGLDYRRLAELIEGPAPGGGRRDPVWRLGPEGALYGGVDPAPSPTLEDADAFWLEITPDFAASAAPIYRSGDRLWISPAAVLGPDDRVAVGLLNGSARLGRVCERNDAGLALAALDPGLSLEPLRLAYADLAWTGRILWASQ